MKSKHISLFLVLLTGLFSATAIAQTGTDWLENTMFSSGKINVVVAVVSVVFILIVVYLISIDRKLKKLEKSDKNKLK
ncbi:CcmD family protein [Cryomorphaceae bacterium 1068]|nr:CcmD family protein [Cryomorphaceae bacterium 1068]